MKADQPNALGRIYIPDERDRNFPMAAALPEAEVRGWRYWWADGWWGDQWYTPQCVAYAWLHLLEDGPVTQAPYAPQREAQYDEGALYRPSRLYVEAQLVDAWPGEDYDGTSVRAGAKVLQREGFISSYRWAWDVDTITKALLTTGPVVVGTAWYEDMFEPDEHGYIHPRGAGAGGHAYLLNGVNTDEGFYRIKNSWGRGWGSNGHARIKISDMHMLLEDWGEACLVEENTI